MGEKTVKEKIWEELKKEKKGGSIEMISMSKKIGCSLAYISALTRYAYESGFLEFDHSGNYIIKEIPPYQEFKEKVNEKYSKYRNATKGTGTRRGASRVAIPKEFKIDEKTILPIISLIIKENRELKEKLQKLIKYVKKIKGERDELMKGINEIDF